MFEILAFLLSLAKAPHTALPSVAIISGRSAFQPTPRAVDNWRIQAALDLDLSPAKGLRWLAGFTPANLPRCIRLNNYWCIKRAGRAGELGADAEGHVAFTSANQAATATVTLLRRYYLDYGRRSARAIVAHWAPAQCGLSVAADGRQPASPAPSAAPSFSPLAKYGIGKTLRARWLATHTRAGLLKMGRSAGKIAATRSMVPDALVPRKTQPFARAWKSRAGTAAAARATYQDREAAHRL